MYKTIIKDGLFLMEYKNPKDTECRYCGLRFAHLHKEGTNLRGFIQLPDLPRQTWEDRFDEEFKNLELDPERQDLERLKDFIRREFI